MIKMTKTKPDIREELKKRVLVLDGAMGTMIQRYQLEEKRLPWETIRKCKTIAQRR